MGVSRKTLSKIINKPGRVTPQMAIRLSLGSSVAKVHFGAESWLGHQTAYDLSQAEQRRIEPPVMPLFATAAAMA
ncbi:MAG: helix-turn-helix transcriptional regulator [Ardenticatenaceae bacterium]